MKKTVVVMQPTYLPWLGYFELIHQADVFVFLDDAQFVHQSWHNRNRLKGADGDPFWITVPTKKHPLDTAIKDIEINGQIKNWTRKHLEAIRCNLGGTPYLKQYFPELENWYAQKHHFLAQLNISGIKMITDWLGLNSDFHLTSELEIQGKRTTKLLNICRLFGADHYYSPKGASVYLDEERYLLEDAGIQVTYQEWAHPVYQQKYGKFASHLSAIDAIMNIGPDACRKLIQNESTPPTGQETKPN